MAGLLRCSKINLLKSIIPINQSRSQRSSLAICGNFRASWSCFSAFSTKTSAPVHDVPHEDSLHRKTDRRIIKEEQTFPESADVVVIGGGSVGCSTAYHLAKLNMGRIVLLEKANITSGTTWHTAGILWNLRDGHTVTRMQIQTRELLSRILPEETGFDAGWLETGSMFVTRDTNQLDALEKKSLIGSEYGVTSRMIDVPEISRLHPLLDTTGLVGAIYSPHDGSLDPATLCTAYIKAAVKHGAQIFENCEVTDIKTGEDFLGLRQVVAVETARGMIKTNNVVNCSGVWAPNIAQMVGLKVPQVTYEHAYVVTQGIPGIEKCPHMRDTENGVYHKRQGDALLFGGYEKNPKLVKKMESDFAFSLYDLDWDHFEGHIKAAISLVPAVAKVGIRSTVCGPESFTSDGSPLMGESPQLRGFFYGSAFNSGGMMMGGGAGRQLAHLVAHGAPEYDIQACDVSRFPFPSLDHKSWLVESCHNHFISRYDRHHAHSLPLGGRNVKKTKLHESHIDNGAFFDCVFGWEIPSYFLPGEKMPLLDYDYFGTYGHSPHTSYPYREQMKKNCSFEFQQKIHDQIGSEVQACKESVAIADVSHLSKFRLTGQDANEAARSLFSSDVTELGIGEFTETLLLCQEGTIVSNVLVYRESEDAFLITAPAQMLQFVARHVNKFLQDKRPKVNFDDVTEKLSILRICGPKSCELLRDIGLETETSKAGWKARPDGKKLQIHKINSTEDAFDVYCSVDDVTEVYSALMTSQLKPKMAGLRALKSLDLEAGKTTVTDISKDVLKKFSKLLKNFNENEENSRQFSKVSLSVFSLYEVVTVCSTPVLSMQIPMKPGSVTFVHSTMTIKGSSLVALR